MKKNTHYLTLSIIAISTILTSCRARFYTPNRNPVPLFERQGDVYFDASTNLVNKYDFTAGYAITNGLGGYIGYAGSQLKTTQNDSNSGIARQTTRQYNGSMLNVGLGYFLNKEQSENFRFEVFADLGIGTYRNKITGSNNQFFNGNYKRIGIMPNIGYTSSDGHFAFAYSIRFSNISFFNPSLSDSGFWRGDINRLNSKASYGLLEHGLNFRVGSESVKFQTQIAFYHGLNSDEVTNAIPFFNASLMFGIVINTNVLRREW